MGVEGMKVRLQEVPTTNGARPFPYRWLAVGMAAEGRAPFPGPSSSGVLRQPRGQWAPATWSSAEMA